ncbi:MAG: hypothetical protein IPH74_11730 [Bacteroidetes bacterium]|nr:hypothetical protein [Bacteroidota bacterium]
MVLRLPPTLNSNTTYYVESENGSGCKSTRTSVTVTIDAAPSSPTVIGTSICSGQTAMLTPGSIRCYVQLVRCCIEWQFVLVVHVYNTNTK